jgi:hypothetical protein
MLLLSDASNDVSVGKYDAGGPLGRLHITNAHAHLFALPWLANSHMSLASGNGPE